MFWRRYVDRNGEGSPCVGWSAVVSWSASVSFAFVTAIVLPVGASRQLPEPIVPI